MRLTEEQHEIILRAVRRRFGPSAGVFLFGSRVDDNRKGGDIDLLVETDTSGTDALTAKLHAISDMQREMGDRKIDLVTASPGADSAIIREARETGLRL